MIHYKQTPHFTPGPSEKLLVVIHWTACSYEYARNTFLNPHSKRRVSAHFLISVGGYVLQLAELHDITWHAGISSLRNYPTTYRNHEWESLNPCSIGIELVGPPSMTKTTPGWSIEQLQALYTVLDICKSQYPHIRLTDHYAIAHGRKIDVRGDTGVNTDKFPWDEVLAVSGIKEA